MGETQPTYAQGAWRAYHITTYRKWRDDVTKKIILKCSCCSTVLVKGTFSKMDKAWYGVVTCKECTSLVNERAGLITLEYPEKVKSHYSKEQQFKLF